MEKQWFPKRNMIHGGFSTSNCKRLPQGEVSLTWGVPWIIIHFRLGFSLKKTIQLLGYHMVPPFMETPMTQSRPRRHETLRPLGLHGATRLLRGQRMRRHWGQGGTFLSCMEKGGGSFWGISGEAPQWCWFFPEYCSYIIPRAFSRRSHNTVVNQRIWAYNRAMDGFAWNCMLQKAFAWC